MHRLLTALLIVALPMVAMAYPSDLRMNLNDLNVTGTLFAQGPVAAVRVTNHEDMTVRCSAEFRNGPERGRARRAVIESGDTAIMSWSPRRQVVRLEVVLTCTSQPSEGDNDR